MGSPVEVLVCPTCRQPPNWFELDENLVCQNPNCARAYPRLTPDIPLVVPTSFEPYLELETLGDLLDPELTDQRLAGIEVGSNTWEQLARIGMYARHHFLDPDPIYCRICELLLPQIPVPINSAVDLGSGPGRLAVEVARRRGAAVVALDASILSLRLGAVLESQGKVSFPFLESSRKLAVRDIEFPFTPGAGQVSWLCADLLNPPLLAEAFDLVLAVNLIDSVRNPYIALGQAAALLRPGGVLLLAQPDAWSSQICPPSEWLAVDDAGWNVQLAQFGLETIARLDGLRWELQRTARQSFCYTLHGRLAIKAG